MEIEINAIWILVACGAVLSIGLLIMIFVITKDWWKDRKFNSKNSGNEVIRMKTIYHVLIVFGILLGIYLMFSIPVFYYNYKCSDAIGRGATWSERMLNPGNHGFNVRNFDIGYNCYYLEYKMEDNEIKSIQEVKAVII